MNNEIKRSGYVIVGTLKNKQGTPVKAYIPNILVKKYEYFIDELKDKRTAYILIADQYNQSDKIQAVEVRDVIVAEDNYIKYAVIGSNYISNDAILIFNLNNIIPQIKLDKYLPNHLKVKNLNNKKGQILQVFIPKHLRKSNIYPEDKIKVLVPKGNDQYTQVMCQTISIDNFDQKQNKDDSILQKKVVINAR